MSLPLWDECAWAPATDVASIDDELATPSPEGAVFAVRPDINRKIHLHLGAGYKIPSDVCVIGQNELLNDHSEDNEAVFTLAGPTLESELHLLAPIQTGESVITSGGTLACEWVVHAVGPRYDERYLTASDHAMFSAYKSALLLAAEKSAADVVLTCIYFRRKKYPRFDAAHVVLRTVRKFLEHSVADSFKRIMFCVPTQEDYEIYSTLLCSYFPRSGMEVDSQDNLLPRDLGDDWGALVQPDRVLKVSAGPQPLAKDSLAEYRSRISEDHAETTGGQEERRKTGTNSIAAVGIAPASMTFIGGDKDEERKAKIAREFAKMPRIERMKLKFQAMLEDLESDELEDMASFEFVKIVGQDRQRRSVVLISAASLQAAQREGTDGERVLLYFMKTMEPLRCRPFVLIYCNSGATHDEKDDEITGAIFDLYSARYKENLMQLYILHASFIFRMYMWMALPFLNTPFWKNYICVANLQQMDRFMEIRELELPNAVLEYDRTLY